MFESAEDMEEKLKVYKDLAEKEEVKNQDCLIFHNPSSCKILDHTDKPAVFYNHTGVREMTFLFEEFMEHIDPMDEYTLREDRQQIIDKLSELYQKPEVVVSNSKFISKKTEEYFGRETEHVYPPVDRNRYRILPNTEKKDYFVSVQRLDWAKRVDVQIKAFSQLDQKLKIIGDGAKRQSVEKLVQKYNNIEYMGRVSEERLIKEMNRAKAVIQTSMMEDFGLVPVESMACGTPVIAPDEGGFRETIGDRNGELYQKPYVEGLKNAVKKFSSEKYRDERERLRQETQEFSHDNFEKQMRKAVQRAKQIHDDERS